MAWSISGKISALLQYLTKNRITRRTFLIEAGAASTVVLAGCAPRSRRVTLTSESSTETDLPGVALVLVPTAKVPASCRIPHRLFSSNPTNELPVTNRLRILRPWDLLSIDADWLNVVARKKWGRLRLFPRSDSQSYLRIVFPPQHLSEWAFAPKNLDSKIDYADIRRLNENPPELSGTSRVVLRLDPRSHHCPLPLELCELLQLERLQINCAPTALPPLGIAPPARVRPGSKHCKGLVLEPDNLVVALPAGEHPSPRAPTGTETAIEFPAALFISPHEYMYCQANCDPEVYEEADCKRIVMWNMALRPRRYQAGCGPWIPERNELKTIRAIWTPNYVPPHERVPIPEKCEYQGTGNPVPPLPNPDPADPTDRRMLVANTAGFDLHTGTGEQYHPEPVEFEHYLMSALGTYTRMKHYWDQYQLPKGSDLDEWRQQTVWGRDQFVLISHAGIALCGGHLVSWIQIRERDFRTVEGGPYDRQVAAPLLAWEYCQVRQPLVHYPADYSKPDLGSRMCFKHIELSPDRTPYLESAPRGIYEDGQKGLMPSWMWPLGSARAGEPFKFTLAAQDRDGADHGGRLPFLWVPLRLALRESRFVKACAGSEWCNLYTLDDAIDEYWRRATWRTMALPNRRLAFVPSVPPTSDRSAPNDPDLRISTITFGVEEQIAPDLKPPVNEHFDPQCDPQNEQTPRRILPEPEEKALAFPPGWRPRFYPFVAVATGTSQAVSAVRQPAEQEMRFKYDRYFRVKGWDGNRVETYLNINRNVNLKGDVYKEDFAGVQVGFNAANAGGLAQPSMVIQHLTRKLGPWSDRQEPALRTARITQSTDVDFSGFNPRALLPFAKLLGGIDLVDIVSPVADILSALKKAPELLSKVADAIEDVQLFINDVRAIKDALAGQAMNAAKTILTSFESVQEQIEGQIQGVLEGLQTEVEAELNSWDLGNWKAELKTEFTKLTDPTLKAAFERLLIQDEALESLDHMLAELIYLELLAIDVEHQIGKFDAEELARRLAAQVELVVNRKLEVNEIAVVVKTIKQAIHVGSNKKTRILTSDGFVRESLLSTYDKLRRSTKRLTDQSLRRLAELHPGGVLPPKIVTDIRNKFGQLGVVRTQVDAHARQLTGILQQLGRQPGIQLSQLKDRAVRIFSELQDRPAQAAASLVRELRDLYDGLRKMFKLAVGEEIATLTDEVLRNRLKEVQVDELKTITDGLTDLKSSGNAIKTEIEKSLNNHITDLTSDIQRIDAELDVTNRFNQFKATVLTASDRVNNELQEIDAQLRGVEGEIRRRYEQAIKEIANRAADLIAVLRPVEQFIRTILGTVDDLLGSLPKELAVEYNWEPDLHDASIFEAHLGNEPAKFLLHAALRQPLNITGPAGPPSVTIDGKLSHFKLHLLPQTRFISIGFSEVSFQSVNGQKPDLSVKVAGIEFGSALNYIKELAESLNPKNGPFVELRDDGIHAGFRFRLDTISTAAFNLTDLAFSADVHIAFDGSPLRLRLAVSERNKPFLITVGIYGGGGFVALELTPLKHGANQLVEMSFEFGVIAMFEIAGIAKGKASITAGIYFRVSGDDVLLYGFVRICGDLDVLGLIHIAAMLYVAVGYEIRGGKSFAAGEAIFECEIDFGFFSITIKRRFRKEFAGSGPTGSRQFKAAGNGSVSYLQADRLAYSSVETAAAAEPSHSWRDDVKRYRKELEEWQEIRNHHVRIR